MKKIKVTIEHTTNKAMLVSDGVSRGWIMNRSYSNGFVNKATFERACADFEAREAAKVTAKAAKERLYPVVAISETDKAIKVLVRVENVHLEQDITRYVWFPKSQATQRENDLLVPGWLILAKLREIIDSLSVRQGSIARLAGFEVGH